MNTWRSSLWRPGKNLPSASQGKKPQKTASLLPPWASNFCFLGCERTHSCCLSHPARKPIWLNAICYQSSRNFQDMFFSEHFATSYFCFLINIQSNWLHYCIFIKTLLQLSSCPIPQMCALLPHIAPFLLTGHMYYIICPLSWNRHIYFCGPCLFMIYTHTHTQIYKN